LFDFENQVVIITGASGSIGSGIAQCFSETGAKLVLHGHSRAPALPANSSPQNCATITADLADPAGPKAIVKAALENFSQVDVLINNAAIQQVEPLEELPDSSWQQMLDINLTAAHRLTQAVASLMIEEQTGGSIIHIASIEGLQPAPGHSHYATTKAALIMHARAAAAEYGPHNIRVNSVSPGLIYRPKLEEQWPQGVARWQNSAALKRLGTPTDVANACMFLASPLASWITGANLVVDGGVSTKPTW